MNFPGDYNGSGAGGFQMPGMNDEGDLTRGYNGPMDPYGGGPPGYARPPNPDSYGPPGHGFPGPNQGPQGYGPGPNQRPPQGHGPSGSSQRPPQGYGPGPSQGPPQGYGPGPNQRPQGYGNPQGYGPPPGYNGSAHSSPGPHSGPQGYRPRPQAPKQRPEMDDGPIGPAPSNYGSSASLPGAGRPQNSQQRPPQQRPPKNQGPQGPPQGASPLGGLDMASLAPLAMGLFGGGNKGEKGGCGAGGLGALAALAPMAMGLLGGGGKSGSSGGGLGPLMGIASSFLGGGGGGGGGNKKSGAAGGDFFSGILAKVFGSGTRDIENGSMQGLGRQEAEHFHRAIYMQQADLRSFSDEQLGAAAAIQAIGQMHRTGSLDGNHEDASQKMLGAVMGEAVSLVERQESMGGSADKEETATAAVRTALKVIDDAADMGARHGSAEPHPMHRDNSFGSSGSQHQYPAEYAPYASSGGYPQGGGYQQEYPGGFSGGYGQGGYIG
ncbi:hypothetical protein LPJ79_005243 [Coemansia sp. RSA 1821]|nr:hypothetical protein LPJ79_005243 [Coemansia sp. RSA 1821]